jgi:tetratricopeptide (TPR) repeat protein
MWNRIAIGAVVCLACATGMLVAKRPNQSQTANPRPLSNTELLALVSGQTLPENIVYEVRTQGIGFTPDATLKMFLTNAGADPRVLAALHSAKVKPSGAPARAEETSVLQHLSAAGKSIKANHLDDAATELTAAINSTGSKSELGFVMGIVLISQRRFEEAGAIYSEILRQDPDFPQIHTRLSLVFCNTGDEQGALRHAKAAEQRNPTDPAAHLNAGLALMQMRKYDAAKSEIQASINSKPDYAIARAAMGSLLDDVKDYAGSIEQYKKALALDPDNARDHYDLGVVYSNSEDRVSAIREYREAKRLDPVSPEIRQNLGASLMHDDPAAAITEFRELAKLHPEWPLCHYCLGEALYRTDRFDDAEREYHLAVQSDPTSSRPYVGLGLIQEFRKNYDQALTFYLQAEKLEPNFSYAYTQAGRVLIHQKDFATAISQLKRAEELSPADWFNHDYRGQALEGSGDRDAAIAEFKEALYIGPKEIRARLNLARAQEARGDWIAALDSYRQAVTDEPEIKIGVSQERFDAPHQYDAAQTRFKAHLDDLRRSGKSREAADLEAKLTASDANVGGDDKFRLAMNAAGKAIGEQRLNDAETSAREAIRIAEKFQPEDARLAEAYGELGSALGWRKEFPQAKEAFKHQLALLQKIYGADSPMTAQGIQNLATLAGVEKDFPAGESLYSQALALNEKTYGENSLATSETLRAMASLYTMKRDFVKAEDANLHVIRIYETMYGKEDTRLMIPYTSLCFLYDQSKKPDQSQSCHAHLVSLTEKQFGANSPYLIRDLTAEAQALRQLGRTDEAAKIESRTQAIQSAQANPN